MVEQKKRRLSPRTSALIAILVIIVATVMAVLYAPPEGDSDNVTGDLQITPTVAITNLSETINVNRSFDVNGVHVSLSQAMLASKFSDDHKRTGTYTVRVMMQTKNDVQQAIGFDYASLVTLNLPDGQKIKAKLSSVKAVQLPTTPQNGFIDFPVNQRVTLADLKLQFNEQTIIPLNS